MTKENQTILKVFERHEKKKEKKSWKRVSFTSKDASSTLFILFIWESLLIYIFLHYHLTFDLS